MPGLFILAEGGGSGGNAPMVILVGALAAFALAYFVVGPGRRRKGPQRLGDIPLAMRPYHSDEELETTGMERAMAWGVALAVFASLFLPLYWLIEPGRINQRVDEFYEQDVAAGRALFAEACASCHGTNLEGGSAPHPNPDIEAPWPAPALNNIVARYEGSEIVDDVAGFILMTLENGRPGTPMPAFGVGEGGQYSDQQLQALLAYILSVQTGEVTAEEGTVDEAQAFEGASGEDIFAANCARCHGQNGEGYVGPQLLNVFERYGGQEGDEASIEQARAVVRDAVLNGRLVPGKAPMPSFAGVLSDDAIEAVIDHIEGFQETGGPRFGQIGGDPRPEGDDE
ncbi:c-type cytochrome [Egicoccus sp. AB-alg2]|uniref:c-type cytochrome n=1 Tax=Egicoccus sp. AB-alg2 TaxID=3242693 RepID=UPI00359DB5A9